MHNLENIKSSGKRATFIRKKELEAKAIRIW
jgi:hypothetical protein